ncbi:hypothetical protein [Actinomadura chokoriensis]|uniref:Uncharacterized protein n=1 Tax=Actinomadura chokoriensis TaxID=454156 RepID=A0ABV4QZ54_9ACTN
MGGKKLAEWERAAVVAGFVTLAVSLALAVLVPDLGRSQQESGISARQRQGLGAAEQARIAKFGTRQLLALNTADLTQPGERRRIADSMATGDLHEELVDDGTALNKHPRNKLTGARVSTFLLTSSGRGPRVPNDTYHDDGWASAMAVVRGMTAGPDGAPVRTVRRYEAMMTLTPQGWRFDYLVLCPDSTVPQWRGTLVVGKPTEEMLFRDEIEKTMGVVLGAPSHSTAERPARDERLRPLTGEGRRRYSAWLARIGIRGGQVDGSAERTAIIRRDRDSAVLLMFVNVRDPDPIPFSYVVPHGDGTYQTMQPPAWERSANVLFPQGGACALKVTVVGERGEWKIDRVADA